MCTNNKLLINVLWTGGLDSTCRIAQLSQMNNIVIQPYYVVDPNRKSVKYEIAAMKTITEIIKNNKKTVAILNDFITIKLSDIAENMAITQSYKELYKKYHLGSQYDFLARFAKQYNCTLEVGLECSPRGKAYRSINCECKKLILDTEVDRLYIDKTYATIDGINVFENLRFPNKLWNMSKLEEVEFMKSLGLESIILKTHFCHNPVLGLTCGYCNPCKDALNEGMAFRVSKIGKMLGCIRKYAVYLPKRVIGKMIRKINLS